MLAPVPMYALFLALWSSLALAVESPVRVEVADAIASPGAEVPIAVRLAIPDGHHVYADQLAIDVIDAASLSIGAPVEPAGKLQADPANPAKQREVYEGEVVVELPAKIPADASGSYVVKLLVSHQACREGLCYPDRADRLDARVNVTGVAPIPGISAAQAQEPAEELAVTFTGQAGAPGTATIHVDLHGEWHLNKMFMSTTLVEPQGYTLGEMQLPAGEKTGSEADGTAREDFVHDFDIIVPVTGAEGAATLTIDVGYQACKGVAICRMPTSEQVKVPVVVGAAGLAPSTTPAPPAEATAAAAVSSGDAFAEAASQGTFALFLFCFLGGVAVSFTPCVLPMVPITLGIIGARGNSSRVESVLLSGAYVLGQALVYTLLGVVAGLSGALFGSWLQNPWVLGAFGALFFVLGLSMFGFFDIQVPGFIQSRISGYDKRGGFVVAFVFGLIGAVLAGPCSGPVVIGILGVIATGSTSTGVDSGIVAYGATLMFVFSLGMGTIFLVAGAASGWMPKRGAYMVLVKKSFGVVMWLGAIYYAAPLFSTAQTALLTAAVLVVTGVFAWPDPDDGEGFYARRLRQVYSVTGVIVGAYLLVGTLMSEGFILPPMRLGSATAAEAPKIAWLRTEAEGLAAAEKAGKPLMIDFTAEWCAACHEMEKYTYTDAGVIAAAEGFVPVMIDCTEKADPIVKAVQEKYGVRGLPTVVFALPDGTILGGTVGFYKAEEFKGFMNAALAKAG